MNNLTRVTDGTFQVITSRKRQDKTRQDKTRQDKTTKELIQCDQFRC
jgi:hypothetical protein